MKRINVSVFIFTMSLFAIACGDKKHGATKTDKHHAHETAHEQRAVDEKPVLKDEKLNAVYQHYVHLTNALINEDEAEAKIAANAIEAGANLIQGGAAIASAAAEIVKASDIEQQRAVYSKLSNSIIVLAKQSGMKSGELFIDYCPMAMNDKGGYWLSSIKPIRN